MELLFAVELFAVESEVKSFVDAISCLPMKSARGTGCPERRRLEEFDLGECDSSLYSPHAAWP